MTYFAQAKTRSNRDVVVSIKLEDGQVLPKSEKTFANVKMRVPPVCPSLIESCPIIKNQYMFEMKVDAAGPSSPIYLQIPIEIGTVPLMANNMYIALLKNVSYEKAITRGKNNDEKIKKAAFINFYDPLYPVFFDLFGQKN